MINQEGNVVSLDEYKARRDNAGATAIDERPWPGAWLIWRKHGDQVQFMYLSATEECAKENLDLFNREGAPCGGGWNATPIWMAGFAWGAKVKAI
jgi:hypothetical protein